MFVPNVGLLADGAAKLGTFELPNGEAWLGAEVVKGVLLGFAAPVPAVKLNVLGLLGPYTPVFITPRLKPLPPAGAGPVPVGDACLFYMANRFTG